MRRFFILILLTITSLQVKSQLLDSLRFVIGTTATAATKSYLPLWLVSNKFGVISDQKFDFSTHINATSAYHTGEEYNPIYDKEDHGFYFQYGIDLFNNAHLRKTIVDEAFISVKHKKMMVRAGRFRQIIGEIDPDLSSGSLGMSGNSLPIPEITASVAYGDVPFTNGFAQFKAQISHGWMGNHQYMKQAFLHEKNLYIKLGRGRFKLYGGVQHYAVWGGRREDLKLDRSIMGFLNVLLVREANDGSVQGSISPNRAGDHRGVIEAGVEWENDNSKFLLNNQTPFDMGQGIDYRNIDRLFSFNVINKNEGDIFKKFVAEFLYTKQMNNFYYLSARESYYNNGVYKTGWEYNDRIIGTPLFINRVRGSKYFDNIEPFDWDAKGDSIPGLSNIISNRVIGGHIGAIVNVRDNLSAKSMITYTRNYGDYASRDFTPSKNQFYTLQEFIWDINSSQQFFLSAGVAFDFGQLTRNFGGVFGIQWHLNNR
ncbi:capsule assembly Wzi family protein [Pedobacter sp. PWIIR3]